MSKEQQQLHAVVDKQQRKIAKYEAKLKDVIAAYKGVLTEKEALEDSVKQLAAGAGDNNELAGGDADGRVASLQRSLATLSEEKTRREHAFSADKRRMLDEYDKMRGELRSNNKRMETDNAALQQQVDALLSSLRQAQRDNAGQGGAQSPPSADKAAGEHRLQLQRLEERLSALRAADERAVGERDARLRIEAKYAAVKESLTSELEKVGERARRAERQLSESAERHTAVYEHRVEELARQLANCVDERDAAKAQVAELQQCPSAPDNAVAADKDRDTICGTVKRLVHSLSADFGLGDDAIREVCGVAPSPPADHSRCDERIGELRRRCDEHQRRAAAAAATAAHRGQSARPDCGGGHDGDTASEHSDESGPLRKALASLGDRHRADKAAWAEQCTELKAAVDRLRDELHSARADGDERERRARQEAQCAVDRAAAQVQRQRGHTVALLDDKQRQIDALTRRAQQQREGRVQTDSDDTQAAAAGSDEPGDPEPPRRVGLDGRLDVLPANVCDLNVYYEREIARRDSELAQLKQDLQGASSSARRAQQEAVASRLRDHELIACLKSELRRRDRLEHMAGGQAADCAGAGGAVYTSEYVRNVLLQYLLSDRDDTKMHMLRALSDALKFTPDEMDKVRRAQHRSIIGTIWQASGKR